MHLEGDKRTCFLEFKQFFCNHGGWSVRSRGAFCQKNYGVSFQMMDKVEVNGAAAHPLYKWLVKAAPGLLGSEAIKWNFTKFLVGPDGAVIKRFAPQTEPKDLVADIEKALALP